MIQEISMIIRLSLLELLAFTGPVLLIGLLLGQMEQLSNNYLQRSFGRKTLLLTAWIGVPVHEVGHLLMCWLFGHRVRKIKLLDLRSDDGTLGYVQHSYDRSSLFQSIGNFFIGIGPMLSGNIFLILSMYILLPEMFSSFSGQLSVFTGDSRPFLSVLPASLELMSNLIANMLDPANLGNPMFWIYIFLALGVSAHIALSRADLKGAARGLPVMLMILILANSLVFVLYDSTPYAASEIFRYNIYLLGFSILSMFFSAMNMALAYTAWSLKKRMS
jgi:hypothetical protein